MARRHLSDKLIPRSLILESLRKIDRSDNAYITPNANVYLDYGDDMMYPVSSFINKHNGYSYINYTDDTGRRVQRRLHRLVALAYLPNPDGLPVVCHKDNDKSNPVLSNLKWGTVSSNTKEAFDDGLARNDSGWDDSQSIPVDCYDLNWNLIATYGSVREASRATGVTISGILYQCRKQPSNRFRKGYIFRFH
jgi:hypothetical protein